MYQEVNGRGFYLLFFIYIALKTLQRSALDILHNLFSLLFLLLTLLFFIKDTFISSQMHNTC